MGTLQAVFTFKSNDKRPIKIAQEPNLVNLQFLFLRSLRNFFVHYAVSVAGYMIRVAHYGGNLLLSSIVGQTIEQW